MTEKINAIIQEAGNGSYYNVLLSALPHKGDYISLFSHLDSSDGHNAMHQYEVIKVVHDIQDVTDKVERSKMGHHSVTVIVKPTTISVD